MNSEARNEFDLKYEGRVQKIREAGSAAIKQLDHLRSAMIVPQTFDAQVARIAQENLHPYGCDLIVHRTADGETRFLIEVQSWEKIRFNQKFFPSS
jgi:hypothetical protein